MRINEILHEGSKAFNQSFLQAKKLMTVQDVDAIINALTKAKQSGSDDDKREQWLYTASAILDTVKWEKQHLMWTLDGSSDTLIDGPLEHINYSILGYDSSSKTFIDIVDNEHLGVDAMIDYCKELRGSTQNTTSNVDSGAKQTRNQKALHKLREEVLNIFKKQYLDLFACDYKFEPCDPNNNEDNAIKDPIANAIFTAWLAGKGHWDLYQIFVDDSFDKEEVQNFKEMVEKLR